MTSYHAIGKDTPLSTLSEGCAQTRMCRFAGEALQFYKKFERRRQVDGNGPTLRGHAGVVLTFEVGNRPKAIRCILARIGE